MEASITRAKEAVGGGVMRSGSGMKSSVRSRPSRAEGRVGFGRQLLAGGGVEVMEKVCQEHEVVRATPVHVESCCQDARRNDRPPLPDAHSPPRPPARSTSRAR